MDLMQWNWWLNSGGGGSPDTGSGLFKELIEQPGNRSENIRIIFSSSFASVEGTYSSASAYDQYDRVRLDANATIIYRALQAVPAGEAPNPFKDTAYWALDFSATMIQEMPDGNWMAYALGFNEDDFIRWRAITLGTLSTINYNLFQGNIDASPFSGTMASGSTQTIIAAPSAYTFTLTTGQPINNKENIGACTSSMTIQPAATTPQFVTIVLPTGQTLPAGQAILLQNTASIFNIGRILTYDSITGDAYVALTDGVGAIGPYSSWTVYKVDLLYGSWNSNPTANNLSFYVDTYDSGTGVCTMTSFRSLGSSSRTTWTFSGNHKGNPIISASQGASISSAASISRGCVVTGRYYGTSIKHRALRRSGGTGWRYIILEGPDAGDEYTIDTYNVSNLESQILVAQNLAYAGESGYAFVAVSIDSPNGSSTNTHAQIDYTTGNSLFKSCYFGVDADTITPILNLAGGGDSSGEFAYRFRRSSNPGDSLVWMPDHSGARVFFGRDRTFDLNGTETIDTTVLGQHNYTFQSFTYFELTQNLELYHPADAGKIADVVAKTRFDRYGMTVFKPEFTLLQSIFLSIGYNNMVKLSDLFFQKMKCQDGVYFTRLAGDTGQHVLTNGEPDQRTYLFYSDNPAAYYKDYALAEDWGAEYLEEWRVGEPDRGIPEIRDSSGPKMYPTPFQNSTVTDGAELGASTRLYAGFWEDVNSHV